jgi:hypothetical protein
MNPRSDRSRGISLLEVSITLAITAVLMVAVFAVVFSVQRGDETIRVRVDLQIEATRGMQELTSLLKTTGPVDLKRNGIWEPGDYPAFTDDGTPFPPAYASFVDVNDVGPSGRNNAATHFIATPDSEGYGGLSNEILFRLPRANDGGQHPTDAKGEIEWGNDNVPTETAYYAIVLVHNPASRQNELQLREYNGTKFGTQLLRKRVLATDVDRIQFMAQGNTALNVPTGFCRTGNGNYDPNLGLNQIRITMWFWKKDINGKDVKLKQSSTVNLRSVQR